MPTYVVCNHLDLFSVLVFSCLSLLDRAQTRRKYSMWSIPLIYYSSWLCNCFSFWESFFKTLQIFIQRVISCVTYFFGRITVRNDVMLFFSIRHDSTWNYLTRGNRDPVSFRNTWSVVEIPIWWKSICVFLENLQSKCISIFFEQ